MNIFDAHSDLLFKLWKNPKLDEYHDPSLQTPLKALLNGKAKVQCLAIFLPDSVPANMRLEMALVQIQLFQEKISKYERIKRITSKTDIDSLKSDETGIILTMEGCEPISKNLRLFDVFFQLGVRSFGLTWNWANAFADGALEKRNAGLTSWGKKLIRIANKNRAWTDVSHLSENSFWDAIAAAKYPIASHSNAYSLCPHPRNLKDDQIKALIDKDGVIGLTFVPEFVKHRGTPRIKDILSHIDHVCSLGGERHIGFGSDFDGIDRVIPDLESHKDYENLIEALERSFTSRQVNRFLFENFVSRIPF
ncbi:dipeptidase [Bacillus swezeyi]|uniref:Diguanylate cyclase n=1 Tax=Bacillus swezeyi TaxID=1925020 RepID=A0A1R1QTP8_9BACI|nr:dipeptidase [Bacillus swezeyi]MEC1260945.1 dipeptidase [Bacillus swezeyi]MED2928882.1 dipeptidase [Bacillus swezeyi]MED2942966.1 dipeptidase [Bacillus swezeyi]MED2964404.1 dipeptidase [Bacillus swezeyi]MED2975874.1 dipeptidase [Bacillus swezeyi]